MRPLHLALLSGLTASAAAQWSQHATANTPPSRTHAAMAFDAARGNTVLFGGLPVGGFQLRGDTWTYDGTDWTQAGPATSPAARFGTAMAFDSGRNVLVMFGGVTSPISIAVPVAQTWEWNGVDWTQAAPAATPSGRVHYGLAHDPVRQRIVMYGGSTNPGLLITSSETWEYDGSTWTPAALTTTQSPGPRQFPGMAWHGGSSSLVLFGGIDPHAGGNADTWRFNGTAWSRVLMPTPGPGPRNAPRFVHDIARDVCVLQGGSDPATGAPNDETWEFDGGTWRQVTTPTPGLRSLFGMAYDSQRGTLLLHGGMAPGNAPLVDTWEYGAFAAPTGAGCPGSNGVPTLANGTPPAFGGTFVVAMQNLANGALVGAIAAGLFDSPPTSLAQFGMPGCDLHVSVMTAVFLPVVGGAVTAQIGIPSDPTLFGTTLHLQGLSFDPGVNAAGFVVSNAIVGHVGW
jgi:hypothetical protein